MKFTTSTLLLASLQWQLIAAAKPSDNPTENSSKNETACREVPNVFKTYNATRTYTMPGLYIPKDSKNGMIAKVDDKPWYLTHRISASTARNLTSSGVFIDVKETPGDGIGVCVHKPLADKDFFNLNVEALERSVNDTGDCVATLGESCVSALRTQFVSFAQDAARNADCNLDLITSMKVPEECRSATTSGSFGSRISIETALGEKNTQAKCDPYNATTYALMNDAASMSYAQRVRFPQPVFMAFFPKTKKNQKAYTDNDVHVEIRCLRPDEIQKGSEEPPQVEELLEQAGLKNSTSPSATTSSTASAGATPSATDGAKGAGVPMRTASPLLVALGWAVVALFV